MMQDQVAGAAKTKAERWAHVQGQNWCYAEGRIFPIVAAGPLQEGPTRNNGIEVFERCDNR